MIDLDADIDIMLADFGEDMSWTDPSTHLEWDGKVIVDDIERDAFKSQGSQSSTIVRDIEVTARTSAFPGINVKHIVTFRSAPWRIRAHALEGDGRVIRLSLQVAS